MSDEGISAAQAFDACAWDVLIDEISASLRLRQGVADGLNRAVGGSWTIADVNAWVDYGCRSSALVVSELVDGLQPTPAQRPALFSPLLDFTAAVERQCGGPTRTTVSDDFAAAAWREVLPTPTPVSVKALFRQQPGNQTSVIASELLKGANELCDVVGNAGLLLIERLTDRQLPGFLDLVFGEVIGAACSELFD